MTRVLRCFSLRGLVLLVGSLATVVAVAAGGDAAIAASAPTTTTTPAVTIYEYDSAAPNAQTVLRTSSPAPGSVRRNDSGTLRAFEIRRFPCRKGGSKCAGGGECGRYVAQGSTEVEDVSGVRVVLVRDSSLVKGYRIQTAFPRP